jgi:hypothetical protein
VEVVRVALEVRVEEWEGGDNLLVREKSRLGVLHGLVTLLRDAVPVIPQLTNEALIFEPSPWSA